MNKKIYFIFAILISLLMINTVKAANVYNFDWESQFKRNVASIFGTDFNGGYVTVSYTDEETIITSRNIRGEVIKEKDIGYYGIIEMVGYQNELYVMAGYDDEFFIAKYDKDLNLLKKKTIGNSYGLMYPKIFDVSVLRVDDNNVIYFDAKENKIVKVDHNLENPVKTEIDSTVYEEYSPMTPKLEALLDSSYFSNKYLTAGTIGEDSYAVGYVNSENCPIATPSSLVIGTNMANNLSCETIELTVFGSDGKEKWNKVLEEYSNIIELKYIDEYLAVIAIDSKEESMDILIYDMKGNLAQKINSEKGWMNITDTNAGFMVSEGYCPNYAIRRITHISDNMTLTVNNPNNESPAQVKGEAYGDTCTSIHKHFYLVRNIETKVNKGKGKVEVVSTSKPGEPVTFVITPEEGYALGVVKVTDADGNVVTFHEYTFTMPSEDVLIEVEFLSVTKNPDTKTVYSLLIVGAMIFAFLFTLYNIRKIEASRWQ